VIEFAWLYALIPALALPFLIWLLPESRPVSGQALRVPFFRRFEASEQGGVQKNRWYQVLMLLAYALFVLALIRPQLLGDPIMMSESRRDLMLAVDTSGSMDTADLELGGRLVSRLRVVQQVAGDFIEQRDGDRIGLIIFGLNPYIQAPLTHDLTTVRELLEQTVMGLAGKETAIGDAIGLAVKRMREDETPEQVLILLTDGANTAGMVSPLQAADLAASEGLKIYTIGVGAEELVVNSMFGPRRINPSADLDEDTLKAISAKTGGRYFRAKDTTQLQQIYAIIDELEPTEREQDVVRPPRELFIHALVSALLIALIGQLLGSGLLRSGRRIS